MGSGWCEKDVLKDLGFELADTEHISEKGQGGERAVGEVCTVGAMVKAKGDTNPRCARLCWGRAQLRAMPSLRMVGGSLKRQF